MRPQTLVLVSLAFCGGLLLHCDLGAPAHADESDGIPYRSGARLKAIVEVSEDGAVIPTGQWWDSEMETRCIPAYASDGSRRCLPVLNRAHQPTAWGFLNADCSGPMVARFYDSPGEPSDPFVALIANVSRDKTTFQIFRFGLEIEPGEGFYHWWQGKCEIDSGSVSQLNRIFEIGEEVEPEAFALLTKTRR